MMLSLILVGLLSSFALGPASFSIIRKMLQEKNFPWAEISGFLMGDVIYIAMSLVLLQSPFMQNSRLKVALTLLTSGTLLAFSLHMLWKRQKNATASAEASSQNGFWGSLLLTLGNFHLVLIYTGLFAGLLHGNMLQVVGGASLYTLSFAGGFILLLNILKNFQDTLQKILRQIEVFVSVGFIFFSFYLSWGTL
ncbi:hypothetical protein D3C87_1352660 [compost metagenome]